MTPAEKMVETRKKKKFLKIYEANMGLLSQACKQADISKLLVDKWERTDPEFELAMMEIDSRVIQTVENKMFQKIEEGDTKMIEFYLKNKGGYRDTKDVAVNANVEFRLNFGTDDEEENKE